MESMVPSSIGSIASSNRLSAGEGLFPTEQPFVGVRARMEVGAPAMTPSRLMT